LLCGYPSRVAAPDDDTGAAERICRLHTDVITSSALPGASPGGSEAVRDFPWSLDSARAARVFVTDRVGTRAGDEVATDAAIVIAELASNAVLHARTPFTVAVSCRPDRVRIAVRDAALLPDTGGRPLVTAPGHGLDLIAKVARRWAVEPLADGKVVWAELAVPPHGGSR
jgi:hypothetical protein